MPDNVAFEAVSIKLARPGQTASPQQGGPNTTSPGQWSWQNVGLSRLIVRGWNLQPGQLVAPPSTDKEAYDIVAKLPAGTDEEGLRTMIRQMLLERFKLAVHSEDRKTSVYEMRVAAGRTRMKHREAPEPEKEAIPAGTIATIEGVPVLSSDRPEVRHLSRGGVVFVLGSLQEISALAHELSRPAHREIVDKTGLSGKYDYSFQYHLDLSLLAPGAPSAAAEPPGQLSNTPTAAPEPTLSFVDSVEQQLGLRLIPKTVVKTAIVVDSFEHIPIAN
ncbi:MAG TPA: TIGR03435 family protein [Acidobacteriaceae bacterium]|nr:TIGR03435 family protein [Acidobacteriaceae bacterium]